MRKAYLAQALTGAAAIIAGVFTAIYGCRYLMDETKGEIGTCVMLTLCCAVLCAACAALTVVNAVRASKKN